LLAYVFLREPLRLVDVIGLALAPGGVFVVTKAMC